MSFQLSAVGLIGQNGLRVQRLVDQEFRAGLEPAIAQPPGSMVSSVLVTPVRTYPVTTKTVQVIYFNL